MPANIKVTSKKRKVDLMWISRNEYNRLKSCEANAKVKTCPFCDGEAEIFTAFGTNVECTKCGAKVYDFCKEKAVSKWNKRIPGTGERR